MRHVSLFFLVFAAFAPACSGQGVEGDTVEADVTAVDVRGHAGAYTFDVTVRSPDTGCEQYADWWEVVSPEGEALIYRRILAHSHVDEQPFTRSGGPVEIGPDSTVVVRAHMNEAGYGGQALRGSVAEGFQEVTLPEDFGDEVEEASPDCRF